jgi:hypothetical protein
VCGKGSKIVLVPLPPAVGRAIDQAIGPRTSGPILLNTHDARMDRHAATRRLRRLAETAGVQTAKAHPYMLRHTFVTTMLDAGVDLRDVQIAARHTDPRTTMRQSGPARTSTATRTTSSPPTWPPAPDQPASPAAKPRATLCPVPDKSARCHPILPVRRSLPAIRSETSAADATAPNPPRCAPARTCDRGPPWVASARTRWTGKNPFRVRSRPALDGYKAA